MIPVEQKREVFSSGVEGSASFEISGKDAAHIMTILRDTLYSDKVLAVLREYSANAWDANRMAGNPDMPIEVTIPTHYDSTLKIRDRGPGLSMEDVFEVYNKYGASTKRDSNTAVGMLGIGSKSGFAYSDTFTIVSYHGGSVATYVAVIDDSEKGRVDLLDVQACDPAETGVEIQIPVRPSDILEFERKAKTLFAFFVPQPKINVVLPEIPKGKDFPGIGRMLDEGDRYNRSAHGWTAVMGCVPYRINLAQLTGVSKHAANLGAILWFDIGALQVAASREELKYGDATKAALVEKINSLIDKYVEFLLDGVDKLSMWERRMRIRKISDLYLPVPGQFKDYNDSHIAFDKDPTFSLKGRNYKGKLDTCSGLTVNAKTRLVFRNDKRHISGFPLVDGDVIVDPTLDEKAARIGLAKALTKHRAEGVPMINISTLPWTKPLVVVNRQVDSARAKAQCLVLDPNNIHCDRKSERWTPVTRTPLDTDVYVVLDSYQVGNFQDFYETYQNDKHILTAVGATMPVIVGYRNTQAHPVVRAKLNGKEYKLWRDDDLVKVLMNVPGVADAVNAKFWSNVDSYATYGLGQADDLGIDHVLCKFYRAAYEGRSAYAKSSSKFSAPVHRVMISMLPGNSVVDVQWAEIVKMYPLFGTISNGKPSVNWAGNHKKEWFEYIKMVDLCRKTEALVEEVNGFQKKEEAA